MHVDESGDVVEGFASVEQEQLYEELVAEDQLPEPTHEHHHDPPHHDDKPEA